jgi:peptide deformylase
MESEMCSREGLGLKNPRFWHKIVVMENMIDSELTVLEIMTYGCPVLKQKAEVVTDITPELVQLAKNMALTMQAAPGIGLAAPQVNRSLRLITIDLSVGEKEDQLMVLINPEIIEQEGETLMEEGCLSVPEINEKVARPKNVVLKAVTLEGKDVILEADGLLARVFCHEVDHLNGKLFIEHLSPLKQRLIKKKFKKQRLNAETP